MYEGAPKEKSEAGSLKLEVIKSFIVYWLLFNTFEGVRVIQVQSRVGSGLRDVPCWALVICYGSGLVLHVNSS